MQESGTYEYTVSEAGRSEEITSAGSSEWTEPLRVRDESVVREKVVQAFRLNRKKQLVLERINKYNRKLMEELKTPRVKASNCALMVIDYTEQTPDPLLPSIWGENEKNKFKSGGSGGGGGGSSESKKMRSLQMEEGVRSGGSSSDGCCTIM